MIEIKDESMALRVDGCVIATARLSHHAAANGNGAWMVSTHPARLFTRNDAITALTLAERLAGGYGDDDPFVIGWREELGLRRIGSSGSRRRSLVAVAGVAAIISCQHAYELVSSHGETGATAHLLPFTVDGSR